MGNIGQKPFYTSGYALIAPNSGKYVPNTGATEPKSYPVLSVAVDAF